MYIIQAITINWCNHANHELKRNIMQHVDQLLSNDFINNARS
jgi:hypothetical protein